MTDEEAAALGRQLMPSGRKGRHSGANVMTDRAVQAAMRPFVAAYLAGQPVGSQSSFCEALREAMGLDCAVTTLLKIMHGVLREERAKLKQPKP